MEIFVLIVLLIVALVVLLVVLLVLLLLLLRYVSRPRSPVRPTPGHQLGAADGTTEQER